MATTRCHLFSFGISGAFCLSSLLVLPALVVPTNSVAATPRALEEIVVTARRRAESVQDVPVAIQALTRDALDRFNLTEFQELGDAANHVDISPRPAGQGGTFIIRGYGTHGGDAGVENGVAVNIDGVQTARGYAALIAFFDLEAIEVLKGPQALYFGKDSPGGVIALRSARPTDTFEARVQTAYEMEAEELILEGMISGPLTDTLRGRMAFRGTRMDGWMRNASERIENSDGQWIPAEPFDIPAGKGSPGAQDTTSIRLTLDWTPTDSFDAIARFMWANVDSDGFQVTENVRCAADESRVQVAGFPPPGYLVDPFMDCTMNKRTSKSGVPEEVARNWTYDVGDGSVYGELDTILSSLEMNLQVDWGTLTSVTGFYDYDRKSFDLFPANSFGQLICGCPEDHRQWTQELRFTTNFDSPLNFMVGGFYESFERNRIGSVKIAAFGFDPTTGFSNTFHADQSTKGTTRSAFAAAVWDINDYWEFSAGGRYSRDRKKGNQIVVHAHDFFAFLFPPVGTEIPATLTTSNFSPEVTLTWRPNSNLTVWGAYKTAYKSGGYANPLITGAHFDEDNITFEPEEAEGGEIGIKSTLLDGRMRLNVTLYDYEFTDLQVTAFNRFPPSFFIQNAATARSRGIELDSEFMVNENLLLFAEVGYNDAKYKDYQDVACYPGQPTGPDQCMDTTGDGVGNVQDLSGRTQNNAPRWSGSFGFDFNRSFTPEWAFRLAARAIYTDDFINSPDLAPQARNSSEWRINARIGLESTDGTWRFALIGRNVTDKLGPIYSQRSGGPSPNDLDGGSRRPRQVLFQMTYSI